MENTRRTYPLYSMRFITVKYSLLLKFSQDKTGCPDSRQIYWI